MKSIYDKVRELYPEVKETKWVTKTVLSIEGMPVATLNGNGTLRQVHRSSVLSLKDREKAELLQKVLYGFEENSCPECGNPNLLVGYTISGTGYMIVDRDGEEVESHMLHDHLDYQRQMKVNCPECGKYLGKAKELLGEEY